MKHNPSKFKSDLIYLFFIIKISIKPFLCLLSCLIFAHINRQVSNQLKKKKKTPARAGTPTPGPDPGLFVVEKIWTIGVKSTEKSFSKSFLHINISSNTTISFVYLMNQ